MKKFNINMFMRWAMKRERDRLARSGQAKFAITIEPSRASYWIETKNVPAPDAKMLDVLDAYAAKLAGVKK